MRDPITQSAPDYKNACLVLFAVNLTWILIAIWAVWGLVIAGLVAAGINHVMSRVHERAVARARIDRSAPRAKVRS
ncbi:histidinol phosphate aminotransferase [Aliishimia ponticola]|uniref:Histidinol phosphate aminotransferase n=1 Tax=Aliishimia ponticola TaxID=2499833 RepID=A0A4V3XKK4_9RHOB|nr:histidinol phosphate aminotransferase [Aliishimia ponticola]THH37323.1 histidinol phosphate aminotransferase [Aliishimia ponticola]